MQGSYNEGPPLIAYILRLMTSIFGNNDFALNFFTVLTAAATCYIIVRIGELIANRSLGMLAACLWLVYPFATTRFVFITANYDCLETLLSLSTILASLLYLQHQQKKYLYLAAIAAGFLLLAKSIGILTLLGIVGYFILNKNERKIFTCVHFYLALALCLAIFSPVLIWNYQHAWASFMWPLTAHSWVSGQVPRNRHGLSGVLFYLTSDVLGEMHILLLILLMTWLKSRQYKTSTQILINSATTQTMLNLLWFIIMCRLFFWLIAAYFAHVALNYVLTTDSILIILSCYYWIKYYPSKYLLGLIILCTLISTGMMINHAFIGYYSRPQ